MLTYLFLMVIFITTTLCHQCIDHNNNSVDWFFIYKLPLEGNNVNELITKGAAYTYMTSDDYENGWKFSEISINDTNSLVGLTLKPLFDSQSANNNVYILYNDEIPGGFVNFKKGHTKGVVLGNDDGGLWLVHSVPQFPSLAAGKYFFSHNGFQYGQSFLCISFDLDNLNKIGKQLQYNEPSVYEKNMPEALKSKLPNLVDVINEEPVSGAPWNNLGTVLSRKGTQFVSFAKGKKFNKELYEDWVAPTFNTNLLVESWLNGPGRLPSDCNRVYQVKNIDTVTVKSANIEFKSSTDHSKWAVTPSNSSNNFSWVCVGDINRAKPQEKRAGGTVCFSNKKVVNAYQETISSVEACQKDS